MKLESQVCTFEQAKKLKKLGIEQKTLWQWKHNATQTVVIETPMAMWIEKYVPPVGNTFYAAYTVAELGVMIPEWHFTYPRLEGYASYKNEDGGFAVADGTVNGQNYDTEAECRAALVIYLLENNMLSAETCNKRLLQ